MSDNLRDGGDEVTDQGAGRGPGADTGSVDETRVLGPVLGCWALLGLGMALAPVGLGFVSAQAGMGTWSTSVGLVAVAGPLVGAMVGLSLAVAVPVRVQRGTVLSAVANGLGFVLFVLVFVAIFFLAAGSRSTLPLVDLLVRLLVSAVPVAITAGGVTGVGLLFGLSAVTDGR